MAWKKNKLSVSNIIFTSSDNNDGNTCPNQTPLAYFFKYFPDQVYSELAAKTNIYSIIKRGKNVNTNEPETRKLVALHIVMGITRFPRLRMDLIPAMKIRILDDVAISRNRFESPRNNLHIVDVNGEHSDDYNLWKVRPVTSSFGRRREELIIEEKLCTY